ncbi:MAG: phosphoribosylformylglycinamidine synthase I [Armatimonadetes bacterium]|nr:phosphoribosylformylglycinamidine synthase I [Armatimonadota bacterium]
MERNALNFGIHTPNTSAVVTVLYGPGINCHEETAFAIEKAGLNAKIVNFQDILTGEERLTSYQAIVIPGGFSWGDHLGSGRIFGLHLVACVADQLRELVETGKPILGICNGFQILVETGLLPAGTVGERQAALLQNKSARFESRWVELIVTDDKSIWTKGLHGRILRMPVAHGEGRLYWENDDIIHPVVCYSKNNQPTEEYPYCPSGSPKGIAGIRDSTGLIFGLMPHPERATLPWHGSSDGIEIFKNLAQHLKR